MEFVEHGEEESTPFGIIRGLQIENHRDVGLDASNIDGLRCRRKYQHDDSMKARNVRENKSTSHDKTPGQDCLYCVGQAIVHTGNTTTKSIWLRKIRSRSPIHGIQRLRSVISCTTYEPSKIQIC